MDIAEFQVESNSVTNRSRWSESNTTILPLGLNLQIVAETVLRGYLLRGWLCDQERNLLDQLAFENYSTFLTKGGSYLHPENTELFPINEIMTAHSSGGQALFRHSYCPEGTGRSSVYTIHSAAIGKIDEEMLIMGFFGPENDSLREEQQGQFDNLVSVFRESLNEAQLTCTALCRRIENRDGNILLDRCSGRVFHIDEVATELLYRSARELVGMEYTQFRDTLGSVMVRLKQTLTNINMGDKRFAQITLADTRKRISPTDNIMSEHFVDLLQNKLSGTTFAASQLEKLLEVDGTHTELELTSKVLEGLEQLSHGLNKFVGLLRYDNLPKQSVNPVVELERAIERARKEHEGAHQISLSAQVQPTRMNVRDDTLGHLFDSIFRSLIEGSVDPGSTHVSAVSIPNENQLLITFFTEQTSQDVPQHHPVWSQYSEKLAARMNIQLEHQSITGLGELKTVARLSDIHSGVANASKS